MTNPSAVPQGYASVGRRMSAYLLEVLLSLVVALLGGGIGYLVADEQGLRIGAGSVSLALWLGQWALLGKKGFTVAKGLLGLRVVDAETGVPIGIGRAFLRYVVFGLLGTFMIPLIILAVVTRSDRRKQGWHDKAVNSVVITTATKPATVMRPGPTAPPPTARPTLPPPSAPPTSAPLAPRVAPPRPPGGLVGPPPGLVSRPSVTPVKPVASAPIEAAPPVISTPPAPPVDERTLMTPPRPAHAAQDGGAPAPATGWSLRPVTGQAYRVEGPTLIGRAPDPQLRPDAELFAVDDPDRTVSKTHAVVTVVDGLLWMEDLDSTHGVLIRRAGDEMTLPTRKSTRLLAGDTVTLGAFALKVEPS